MNQKKKTTQSAPLERILTRLRTKKIFPFIQGKNCLDFGCGAHSLTLKTISKLINSGFGFDILHQDLPPQIINEKITLIGDLFFLKDKNINCVISLACFEHLERDELVNALKTLKGVCTSNCVLIGTVPTPRAKPVLEFLSYKLRLIDPSQIRDHKVYYDRAKLERVFIEGGWKLNNYKRFQMGMNSLFKCVLFTD